MCSETWSMLIWRHLGELRAVGHIHVSSSSTADTKEVGPSAPKQLELRLGTGEVMENSKAKSDETGWGEQRGER